MIEHTKTNIDMVDIDWSKLKFSYTKTRAIVYSRCIDGEWEAPVLTEDFNIPLSSFAGVFHYAPACFEGLKAFRGVDGKIRLFRPDTQMSTGRVDSYRVILRSGSGGDGTVLNGREYASAPAFEYLLDG